MHSRALPSEMDCSGPPTRQLETCLHDAQSLPTKCSAHQLRDSVVSRIGSFRSTQRAKWPSPVDVNVYGVSTRGVQHKPHTHACPRSPCRFVSAHYKSYCGSTLSPLSPKHHLCNISPMYWSLHSAVTWLSHQGWVAYGANHVLLPIC